MRLMEVVESQQALGGMVQIGLIMSQSAHSRPLFDELWLEVFSFEKTASRFLENSELTQLNRNAVIENTLSPRLRDVLLSAKRSADFSDGLFNPFVLPAVQRAGYTYSVTDPNKSTVSDVRKRRIVSANDLEVGETSAKIPYGTALDLGGCGKGHIVDVLATIARKNGGVEGGWIEASGDLFAWGHDNNSNPITIAVQSVTPNTEDLFITIPESGLGVATSGTYARPNIAYTKNAHHIIDPRTDEPAVSDIRLATVCAKSGLEADVLASCAIIVELNDAPGYLSSHGATDWILQPVQPVSGAKKAKYGGAHLSHIAREVQHA